MAIITLERKADRDRLDSLGLLKRVRQLNSIGIALSTERNTPRLLEKILMGAKALTNADAGTLYTLSPEGKLIFQIIRTKSKSISMGGTSKVKIPFDPISLYDNLGLPNDHMVAAYSVLKGKTVNVADAYTEKGFDFSGTREFDKIINYRSKSFLTVPMRNHENNIIGVLQLINKMQNGSGKITTFTNEDEQLAESLASQAAVALTNKELVDELNHLFESFTKTIAAAVDEKSSFTGEHCKRVPALTMLLAEAASDNIEDFTLSNEIRYELELAAWLHDCGKITTPKHVIDKATKLETIIDRIHLVDSRIEIVVRDAEIEMLRKQLVTAQQQSVNSSNDEQKQNQQHLNDECQAHFQESIRQLRENQHFLHKCNVGSEFMSAEEKDRVAAISTEINYRINDKEYPLLNDDEILNLQVSKGTLNQQERNTINNHINVTIKMLSALPFPKHLQNVPEFAGGHHERIDGKGYPNRLIREQMSVPARIMAIADIFEALTSKARPYKEGTKLSEALSILGKMKLDQHIDPDLFDIFIENKLYLDFAKEFLDPDQLDVTDPSAIPGYPFD